MSAGGFTRVSGSEWRWTDGRWTRSVRYFPVQGTLVWSAWTQGAEGPVFEDGLRQLAADFLQDGPPPGLTVPDGLMDALRAALTPRASGDESGGGWLLRLFGRRDA